VPIGRGRKLLIAMRLRSSSTDRERPKKQGIDLAVPIAARESYQTLRACHSRAGFPMLKEKGNRIGRGANCAPNFFCLRHHDMEFWAVGGRCPIPEQSTTATIRSYWYSFQSLSRERVKGKIRQV